MTKKKNAIIVKDEFPLNIKYNTIFNITTKDVNNYTHGFHKYPAKFIPQIPKWAINKYINNKNDNLIIDPFCGSGTTLVESSLAGFDSIGIDIDPLSVLISKVKSTRIDLKYLEDIYSWVVANIKEKKEGYFHPECSTISHWFSKDAYNSLSKIRTVINDITNVYPRSKKVIDIQDLFLICLSSIIRKVSYADDESQKTYVSHTKIKIPIEVYQVFFPRLLFFKDRIKLFTNNTLSSIKTKIINSTSINNLTKINKKASIAITSPPYIKTIDYIYNQMVELFWIGDKFGLQTQEKQNRIKNNYVGNKHIYKSEYYNFNPSNDVNIDLTKLEKVLIAIIKNDFVNGKKHSFITYKFFSDMEKHFYEMSKTLKSGSHYIMVVGNSKVSNILIDTSEYLPLIAKKFGFELFNKWGYVIKNRFMRFDRKGRGGIIDIDWVLDFIKE